MKDQTEKESAKQLSCSVKPATLRKRKSRERMSAGDSKWQKLTDKLRKKDARLNANKVKKYKDSTRKYVKRQNISPDEKQQNKAIDAKRHQDKR